MMYQRVDYFTSKIEIKPQLVFDLDIKVLNYFTSKIEIKPQQGWFLYLRLPDYFTSKIEIKPQPAAIPAITTVDYFTSKIEIKPQLFLIIGAFCFLLFYIKNRNQTTTYGDSCLYNDYYFTSKIEIKPQPNDQARFFFLYYFTSKIEIKPQLWWIRWFFWPIILHQK